MEEMSRTQIDRNQTCRLFANTPFNGLTPITIRNSFRCLVLVSFVITIPDRVSFDKDAVLKDGCDINEFGYKTEKQNWFNHGQGLNLAEARETKNRARLVTFDDFHTT